MKWEYAGAFALAVLAVVSLLSPPEAPPTFPCLWLVRGAERALTAELDRSSQTLTLRELDILEKLARTPPLTNATYFDRHGAVRWARDASLIGVDPTEFERRTGIWKSIYAALERRGPVMRARESDFDEISVPLYESDELRGLVLLNASKGACRMNRD